MTIVLLVGVVGLAAQSAYLPWHMMSAGSAQAEATNTNGSRYFIITTPAISSQTLQQPLVQTALQQS